MNKCKTIIVAGQTRSGLTLTMQMLDAGGVPCAGEFPAYEPYPVGCTPWGRLTSHAVKLVDSHRHFPPPGDYLVILLKRNFDEQAKSVAKWLRLVSGVESIEVGKLRRSLESGYRTIERWASQQDGLLRIRFESLITNPQKESKRIAAFIQEHLDEDAMQKAVIKRGTDCYDGLLELQLLNKNDGN